jgi:acyl carrier protein
MIGALQPPREAPREGPDEPRPRKQRPEILAAIRGFIATWFRDGNEQGLTDDAPLVTSGIVDSAGVVEVVEFLEERFGVRITDADISLRNCNTLAGLADLVASRL